MKKALIPLLLSSATLAGCMAPTNDEPVRIRRSTANEVVLHGLIDASRTTPPARYDTLAQSECAKAGKSATFIKMEQKSTFAFDVAYRCLAKV